MSSINQISSISEVSVLDRHDIGSLVKINISSDKKEKTAKKLAELLSRKDVEYVVENIKMHAFDKLV